MDNIKFEKVPVGELHNLLEPNIYNKLEEEQYSILKCSPYELLSYRRFDIAFKALFLEMLNKNRAFGTRLYKAHISAFSLGQFKEPNNNEKNSLEKFIEEFINIYNTINERGFDANKSLIPLSNDNIIRNGAHRFASALEANKDIYCIKTEVKGPVYDYKFFYERNVSSQFLDIAATKFAEISLKTQIALVWPSAVGYDTEIEEYLGKVIYKKDVYLNMNGAHNLMSQVYAGEKWLGSLQNDFNGTKGKIVGCFTNHGPLRVILFESDSLNEVLIAKDNIRKIFNIGKHAIHITDRHDEVLKLSKILF